MPLACVGPVKAKAEIRPKRTLQVRQSILLALCHYPARIALLLLPLLCSRRPADGTFKQAQKVQQPNGAEQRELGFG